MRLVSEMTLKEDVSFDESTCAHVTKDRWKKTERAAYGTDHLPCHLFKSQRVLQGMQLSNNAKNGAKHFPPVRINDTT